MPVAAPVSFCTVCDALPGECAHTGPRYLADIEYEKVERDGEAMAWRVPEHERDRWEHPVMATPPAAPGVEPEPLDILVARLEPVIDLSFALEGRLAAAHNRDALRTTRIVVHVLRAAVDGSLKSPGGYLWKRLGELLDGRR